MAVKELETDKISSERVAMLALLRPSLVGNRGSVATGCRLGRLTVLCPRLGQFVSQSGALTVGAVKCAVEAIVFAL
jgi:hypothetical protein